MPGVGEGARRYRVLWVIKGLGPGGAEQLLVGAARAHDRSRFELEVAYLLPWKDALVPALEAEGVRTHCLGVRSPADPRWVARLARLLRAGRYDVVHTHSPAVAPAARLAARLLALRPRPAVVATEHNVWSSFRRPSRWCNALTYPLVDAAVAVSDAVRDSMWPLARRRAETVHHGIDPSAFAAAAAGRTATRAAMGVAPEEVLVLTVANLRANKAYPDLLAAARAVCDRGLPVRFAAVGQGPLAAEVAAERDRLGLAGRFELLGHRTDVPALLAAADVFVLGSRHEGYPVAVMEAQAAGLPVVATAVGGVPDLVADGADGLLVPPGRPDRLADALARLVADEGLRRRLAEAAARRGTQHSVAPAVRHIEAIYEGLIGRMSTKPDTTSARISPRSAAGLGGASSDDA